MKRQNVVVMLYPKSLILYPKLIMQQYPNFYNSSQHLITSIQWFTCSIYTGK